MRRRNEQRGERVHDFEATVASTLLTVGEGPGEVTEPTGVGGNVGLLDGGSRLTDEELAPDDVEDAWDDPEEDPFEVEFELEVMPSMSETGTSSERRRLSPQTSPSSYLALRRCSGMQPVRRRSCTPQRR